MDSMRYESDVCYETKHTSLFVVRPAGAHSNGKSPKHAWGVSNTYKVQKFNQLIRGWINYFKIGSMNGLCK